MLHGGLQPSGSLAPLAWHAHEMIYGVVMAGLAGFLLTAVPNWTGRTGYSGPRLAALVCTWLLGRLAMSAPLGLPPTLIAVMDLAFPLVLMLVIATTLVRAGNRRNFVFIAFLALLLGANLHFHLLSGSSTVPLTTAVNTVLLMVATVGGRIVPTFTTNALKKHGVDVGATRWVWLDVTSNLSLVAVLLVDLIQPGGIAAGVTAALAATLLAARLCRWHGHRTLAEPIVWVLHLAYAWLPVALGLKAAWLLAGWVVGANWLHALTAGGFSTALLAVMSRAALGHTGRELVASKRVVIAYVLLTVAALVRVFGPISVPAAAAWSVTGSALAWSAAFALFVWVYAPMVCAPRVDGRPE